MPQADLSRWATSEDDDEPDEGPEEREPAAEVDESDDEPADDLDGDLEIPVQAATLTDGAARALAVAATREDPPWDPLACPWSRVGRPSTQRWKPELIRSQMRGRISRIIQSVRA